MKPLIKSSQVSNLPINTPSPNSEKLYPFIHKESERKKVVPENEAFRKLRSYIGNTPQNDNISHHFKDKSLSQSTLMKSFSRTSTSFAFDKARTPNGGQFFMPSQGYSPMRKTNFLDDSKDQSNSNASRYKKNSIQLDTLSLHLNSRKKVPVSHFLFENPNANSSVEIELDSKDILKPLKQSISVAPSKALSVLADHIRTPSIDMGRTQTAKHQNSGSFKVKLSMNEESSKSKLRRIGSSGTFKMQTKYEPGLGLVQSRSGLDFPQMGSGERDTKRFWFKLKSDVCMRNRLNTRSGDMSRTLGRKFGTNEEIIRENKDCIMVCVDHEGDYDELEYCFVKRDIEKDHLDPGLRNGVNGDIGLNMLLYEIKRKLRLGIHHRFLYTLGGEWIYELKVLPKNENVIVISRQEELGPIEDIVQNDLVAEFFEQGTKKNIGMYSQVHMANRMLSIAESKQEMTKKYNEVLKVLDDESTVQLNSGQLAHLVNSTKEKKLKEVTDTVHKILHKKKKSKVSNGINKSLSVVGLGQRKSDLDNNMTVGSTVDQTQSYGEKLLVGIEEKEKDQDQEKSRVQEYVEGKELLSNGEKLNVYKEIMGYYKKLRNNTIDPQEEDEKFVGAVDSDEDSEELKQKETLGLVSKNLDGLLKGLKNTRKKKLEAVPLKQETKSANNTPHAPNEVHFAQSEEKLLDPENDKVDHLKKDFIKENIRALNTKKNDINKLYQVNRELFMQNIPKYIKEKNLSRKELHLVYVLYKALCEVTSQRYKRYNLEDGIDYHSFRNGIYQVFLQSEEVAEKVFYKIDHNFSGFLNWEEFLNAMVIIRAKTMKDKIDIFIKIADEDGNGNLSKEEIYNLAKICLGKFIKDSNDGFLSDLCEYFTRLIFESVGIDINEEIPLQSIKDVITSKGAESDLLAMFCGADI